MADLVEFLRALDDGSPLPTQDFPEGLTTTDRPPTGRSGSRRSAGVGTLRSD